MAWNSLGHRAVALWLQLFAGVFSPFSVLLKKFVQLLSMVHMAASIDLH
jgi:hypothetical protein